MKRQQKKYEKPLRPWDKGRIETEKKLKQDYGLRRKKEIWRAESILRNYRRLARNLAAKRDKPKEKILLDKLTQEFNIFKKYNKSADHDKNFDAFFKSYHLLDANEKQSVKEYLEEADSNDAIDKILLMGKDYRELFESGLNQHKNIFAYVNDLHAQISKLNEEINKFKENVDIDSEESNNKQIKSRYSLNSDDNYHQKTNEFDRNLLKSLNIL